jgi:glyoxylase-like metal-dependent hydrolase (beta-lactamase superfamily II)
MSEVKVLIEGTHIHLKDDVLEVGSTTTLIKSDKNIIVDPGAFVNKNKLIKALESEGLKPENIDVVILTHTHIDHTVNIPIFSKAKIYSRLICGKYSGQYQLVEEGKVCRFDLLNEPIANGVKILETPGHTIDSITVLVDTKEGVVAIAGDAIATADLVNLEKHPLPDLVYSLEKYEESRKKILTIADWIVPGHGKMFKLTK